MKPSNHFFRPAVLFFIGVAVFLLPATLFAESGNDTKDFSYWFERGALLSVYGNQDAAVGAFQKAIELEADNAEAHFNLGMAYTEMDEYEKALDAMSRAIELKPGVSRYYYGRGWVHIRSGNRYYGMEDMQIAAELSDRYARKFIEEIDPRYMGN